MRLSSKQTQIKQHFPVILNLFLLLLNFHPYIYGGFTAEIKEDGNAGNIS